MKQDRHPDEFTRYKTLSTVEQVLLGNKTGPTQLWCAVLLKAFQFEGGFPVRREGMAGHVVTHLATEVGVSAADYGEGEWSERTQRYHRAQIRAQKLLRAPGCG